MPRLSALVLFASTVSSIPVCAGEFDTYGSAAPGFIPIDAGPAFIFELGASVGFEPAYAGASTYTATYGPVIGLDRLRIPGLIDIGGGEDSSGFSLGPSFDITSGRVSAEHEALRGLADVAATYSAGALVGYGLSFSETMSFEVFGEVRYGFGGSQGLLGDVGANLTAHLTPELEITAGSIVSFASESYMDAYFGVTSAEAAATGGRMMAYDPTGGLKSAGVSVSARYEFIPDAFLNLEASYSRFLGAAYDSPIVQTGSPNQFVMSLGLSRRFAVTY